MISVDQSGKWKVDSALNLRLQVLTLKKSQNVGAAIPSLSALILAMRK
jgi:hypothetical protein